MANLITPISLIPQNAPVECASSDTVNNPIILNVGTVSSEKEYFSGVFYRAPDNNYIGVDIGSYIKDIVNLNELTPAQGSERYTIYKNLIKYYRAIMRAVGNTTSTVFDFTGSICAIAPNYRDVLLAIQGAPFGVFKNYIDSNKNIEKFENGLMVKGQIDFPNWDVDTNLTVSEFPLVESFYQINYDSEFPGDYLFDLFFDNEIVPEKQYILSFDILKDNVLTDLSLFCAGKNVSSKVSNFYKTITLPFKGSEISALIPLIRMSFFGYDIPAYVRIRNISVIEVVAVFYRGLQYDILLHSFLDTFENNVNFPNVIFNKTLKNAPVCLNFWNPNAVGHSLNVSWHGYNLEKAEQQSIEYGEVSDLYADFQSVWQVQQQVHDYPFSGFTFKFGGLNEPTRGVYFEQIDPTKCKGDVYQLYFVNRLMGIDWIVMSGANFKSSVIEKEAYTTSRRSFENDRFTGDLDKQVRQQYLTESEDDYILNSDTLTAEKYKYLEECVTSPKLWLWDAQDETLRAVYVVDTNFNYKQFLTDKSFNFQIKVRSQFKNAR